MIRVAEPLAWEVDVEPVFAGRQLRLVPDESTGGAVASETTRGVALEGIGSLADLVLSLRSGSDCLWCGGTLVSEGHSRLRLVCPSCGAEVETLESVHGGGVRL